MKIRNYLYGSFILGLVLAFCSGFQMQKSDVTGEWLLNLDKSQFGDIPIYTATKKYSIVKSDDKLIVHKVNLNEDLQEQSVIVDTFSFKEKVIKQLDGKTKYIASEWIKRPLSFKQVSEYTMINQNEMNYKTTDTWSVSEDGNELKIERLVKYTNKDFQYTLIAVYDRK